MQYGGFCFVADHDPERIAPRSRLTRGHVFWWLAGSQLRDRCATAGSEARTPVAGRAAANGQTVHGPRSADGLAPDTPHRELVLSLARIHGSRVREDARFDVSRRETLSDAARNGARPARRRVG